MKPEDRTEFCTSCGLEVPWGTTNKMGWCIECASLRPAQRFGLREGERITGQPWTKADTIWMVVLVVVTISVMVTLILTR